MSASSDEISEQLEVLTDRLDTAEQNIEGLRSDLEDRSLEEKVRELERLVNRDPNTDLPIMRQFYLQLQHMLEPDDDTPKPSHLAVGLLRLDNGYSRIRNTRDRNRVLLFKTGDRLRKAIGDNVYQSDRFDEFLVILRGIVTAEEVVATALELLEEVAQPHAGPANDISFGAYIGLALYPDHGESREDLVRNAEIALGNAVRTDSRAVVYNDTVGAAFREREQIEYELRRISRSGFENFSLVFQPFVDQNNVIRGGESLIRWNHPEIGPVSPGRFIPIAEEGGAIRFLGQWSLYQSCRHIRELPDDKRASLYISVNLSPQQFKQPDLVDRIGGILESTDLEANQLNLEVTETIVMDEPENALAKMKDIKSLGVRLALDDFGTGYSSLSYLGQFEFDTLKIDRSFVDRVDESDSAQTLLRAMLSMARAFGMKALAEGVERQEELDFLWSEGCDLVQGYYFSKPLPWTEFVELLEKGVP